MDWKREILESTLEEIEEQIGEMAQSGESGRGGRNGRQGEWEKGEVRRWGVRDERSGSSVSQSPRLPASFSHLIWPPGYSLEAVRPVSRNLNEAEPTSDVNHSLGHLHQTCLLIYFVFPHFAISLAVISGIPVAFAGGIIAIERWAWNSKHGRVWVASSRCFPGGALAVLTWRW